MSKINTLIHGRYGKIHAIMRRGNQTIRQIMILQELESSSGVSIKSLMSKYGVNYRTIQRDLEALQEAEFPVVDETLINGEKLWRLVPGYQQRLKIPFTLSELVSLYLALEAVSDFRMTPFFNDVQMLCKKIQSGLDDKSQEYFDALHYLFYTRHSLVKQSRRTGVLLKQITEARMKRQTLAMKYTSRQDRKTKKYIIDPYILMPHDGLFFLHAYVHEYNELRTFTVDKRMKELKPTGETFLQPDKKVIDDRIQNSFGLINEKPFNVKIRFNSLVEERLRTRTIHPSQKIEKIQNGDILFSMHAGGRNEIIWWVLSFGPLAEVLEPVDMRETIRKTLQDSLTNYNRPSLPTQ
jgi:predicted DNA-binding transcriptional regulator YafY